MRPMRVRRGFELPQIRTVSARLAVAVVVVSVLCALVPELADWVVLSPRRQVLDHLFLWQPLTYGFLDMAPLGIVFDALIIWQTGTFLEATWGPKRLLRFALGITVLSGLLTVAFALLLHFEGGYTGARVMSLALWVGYGLYIGKGQTNFWGMPVTGNVLALIGAGFILISAAAHGVRGFLGVLPEIFGLLLTLAYIRGGSPRVLLLRFKSWWLQRQLRGRSKHLHVMGGGKDGPPRGSDRFLH